jgi:hypothetical protein
MSRFAVLPLLLVALAGCQLTDDRAALRPLPEDAPPRPYAELLTRARQQASLATNAFYVNNWADLEDAAKGLEQTARHLGKATDVPENLKDTLPAMAGKLGQEAGKLKESASAKEKDVKLITDQLTSINTRIREMRLEK